MPDALGCSDLQHAAEHKEMVLAHHFMQRTLFKWTLPSLASPVTGLTHSFLSEKESP